MDIIKEMESNIPLMREMGDKLMDDLQKYGVGIVKHCLSRAQIINNRIWCKALVRLLKQDNNWMKKEENQERFRLLSNLTQCLRYNIANDRHKGGFTRNALTYRKVLNRLHGSWCSPKWIMFAILKEDMLHPTIIGSEHFIYAKDIQRVYDEHLVEKQLKNERRLRRKAEHEERMLAYMAAQHLMR